MRIKYEKIDNRNRNEALMLHIKSSQIGTIESIEESLAEAENLKLWQPMLIKIDDKNIAFAMAGYWENEGQTGRLWLDRYFVDENYQGRGYGKIILEDLIRKLFKDYNVNELYLSVYESNVPAINLYKKLGFIFNGEKDINGELVMIKYK